MVDTLATEPRRFFYYNNGITMVCDRAERISNKARDVLRVSNPQIINGQQTSRVLAEEPDGAEHATVVVKVIRVSREGSQEPASFEELVSRIVQGTNWQNAIKPSDLMSNDRRQIEIERALRKLGYHYLRKREKKGESRRRSGGKRAIMIKKEELAQAVAGCELDPVVARSGKDNLFEEQYNRWMPQLIECTVRRQLTIGGTGDGGERQADPSLFFRSKRVVTTSSSNSGRARRSDAAGDLLVVSAFAGSYLPTKGTLIGALSSACGISVADLRRNCEYDLTLPFGIWIQRTLRMYTSSERKRWNWPSEASRWTTRRWNRSRKRSETGAPRAGNRGWRRSESPPPSQPTIPRRGWSASSRSSPSPTAAGSAWARCTAACRNLLRMWCSHAILKPSSHHVDYLPAKGHGYGVPGMTSYVERLFVPQETTSKAVEESGLRGHGPV